MKQSHGFTLIELMIGVAIVALIASIAYPSYQEQVRKTRRADCSGALAALSQAMERHYTINSTYRGAAAGGADTGAPAVYAAACPVDGGTPTYNLTIADADGSTYRVEAAPIGSQATDKCGTFALTNTGVKSVAGADAGVTWQECW